MIDIFMYTDFKKYLDDYYKEKKKKNPHFSHRYIGQKVGFSPGYFSRILMGKKKMSEEMITKFQTFLNLSQARADYFKALVKYNQAQSTDSENKYYQRMLSVKQSKVKKIEVSGYDFFREWYHSAVFSMIKICTIQDTTDFQSIGKLFNPSLSSGKIQSSIKLLKELNLITCTNEGVYKVRDHFMSIGEASKHINVKNFLKSGLYLADKAIDTVPFEERQYSSLIVTTSENGYTKICKKLKETRKEINKIVAEEKNVSSAYQINFQIFPIFKQEKDI